MHALFCLAKENKKINKKIPKKPPKLKKSCSFHLAGEWWKTAKNKADGWAGVTHKLKNVFQIQLIHKPVSR